MDDEQTKIPKKAKDYVPVTLLSASQRMSFEELFCTQRIEEEIFVELNNTGEKIEKYWSKGWVSGYIRFHRSDFDQYDRRYHKTFPTRYRLEEFKLTKNLRRVLNKNRDLKTIIRPLRITEQKTNLFVSHHIGRFEKLPRKALAETYKYIKHYPSKLMELCIFKDKNLIACSIFEVGNTAVYSNTAFWDLRETKRSLGILTVLLETRYAIRHGMRHYYLGFYYTQNPNYQYKTRFSGLELFDWNEERWIPYRSAGELLEQTLPRQDW